MNHGDKIVGLIWCLVSGMVREVRTTAKGFSRRVYNNRLVL